MREMTRQDRRTFLKAEPRTAKLATVREDGRPHIAPIWFVLDGDDVVFTTGAQTVKGRNLRRDPRVTVCVDDEAPPYAYVRIDGTARVVDDAGELLRWCTIIGGRYMGAERAEEFGRRNAVPSELLVRLTPARIVAFDGIAD